MGFRDLTHFNKALLAKQVRRILENPNSLVARLLKARYFKHTNIMDATLSSSFNPPMFGGRCYGVEISSGLTPFGRLEMGKTSTPAETPGSQVFPLGESHPMCPTIAMSTLTTFSVTHRLGYS